jgi:hypothetical protein
MDHCSFYDQGMLYALDGQAVALVVRDVATTFGSVFPSHSKDTEETVAALQHFIGDSHVKRFYSDNADELVNATSSSTFLMKRPSRECHRRMA